MLSGNSLRQTVHTHRASAHQAAKFVAALLRVAGVTAGLVESNGTTAGFMTHVTYRLNAKNRDQFQNIMLGTRVQATFTFLKCTYQNEPKCRTAKNQHQMHSNKHGANLTVQTAAWT